MSAVALAGLKSAPDEATNDDDGSIALGSEQCVRHLACGSSITERALAYLQAGYAVHFWGQRVRARRRLPSMSPRSSAARRSFCMATTNSAAPI